MRTCRKTGQYSVYPRLFTSAIVPAVFCLALAGRAASEEPSISLIRPNGGEVWCVGTTPHIKWTATDVDNVRILYSTDGGVGWDMVAPSVRVSNSSWGDYPWVIPDTPSTECLIHVSAYIGGEFPTQSAEVFEIRSVTDIDADGMDDDWETLNFGHLFQDGTTDSDGDGMTDYEEFMAGTDPLLADPAIALEKTSLLFSAVEGKADPADKAVNVTNSGGGTLGEVRTTISYESGSGWLTITGSGPGNAQTLTNTIDISGLQADTYTATVTVSGGGAFNSEEYTVTLTIETNQAPSVDAGSDRTVELGSAASLAGFVEDDGLPYGTLAVTWSLVSGPGDASFTNEHDLVTNVTFTEIGIYWIRLTASDGDLEDYDQLSVTVTEPHQTNGGSNGGCAAGRGSPRFASVLVAFLAGCTHVLKRLRKRFASQPKLQTVRGPES